MPRGFRDQGSTSDEQNVEMWLGAGFAGRAVSASAARFTSAESSGHRALEARSLDCGRAGGASMRWLHR